MNISLCSNKSIDLKRQIDYKYRSRGCSSVVERDLAKVEVAGSNPVTRFSFGDVAEWLGSGLQNRVTQFNSGRRLLGLTYGTLFCIKMDVLPR